MFSRPVPARCHRVVGVVAFVALVGAVLLIDAAPAVSAATPTTVSFTTPGVYDWTVPAGVTSVEIDMRGAQGGGGEVGTSGGLGGRTVATLDVTSGDTLKVHVGAAGTTSGYAGANGGGPANVYQCPFGGGSGGDASDVRLEGDQLDDRLVVAGGGGCGGGGWFAWGPRRRLPRRRWHRPRRLRRRLLRFRRRRPRVLRRRCRCGCSRTRSGWGWPSSSSMSAGSAVAGWRWAAGGSRSWIRQRGRPVRCGVQCASLLLVPAS